MTQVRFRTLRLLLTRLVPVTLGVSLFTTGLVTASQTGDARATVSDKVQALTDSVADPGFSRVTDTGHSTQLVGFEWEGRHEGALDVRARQGGGWSSWQRLEGDLAEGPDLDSPEHHDRTTAGPVWVGKDVRQVEVRVVEGSLTGVKLHALRSENPSASGGTKPAGASPAQPGIVSRAAWGADESYRSLNPGCGTPEYASSVRMAIVHHTASPTDYTPADSAPYMRAIYYFHTHTNAWCDIGYNFVVDRFGTVFEGRAGGVTRAVIGAHALNFNNGSTGVALLGTFNNDAVPSAMYGGLRSLLAWKLSIHGIDPLATISFNNKTLSTVSGHRDVNSTDCPGDMPEGLLPQLRRDLSADMGPSSTYALQSAWSGQFVDVAGGSRFAGDRVIQWPNNGYPNQRWKFDDLGNNVFRIVSVNSGLVLDVAGASTEAGAPVIQWQWNGGLNQQWNTVFLTDASSNPRVVVLQSMKSGMVIDLAGASTDAGAQLIQWPWAGYANQEWWRYQS